MADLGLAGLFGLLNQQITEMDVRLSRQFVDQSGSLRGFEEHFTAWLGRMVEILDAIQAQLEAIEKRLPSEEEQDLDDGQDHPGDDNGIPAEPAAPRPHREGEDE